MAYIQLTQGFVAEIDDEDYEKLNKYKWCIVKNSRGVYAMRKSYSSEERRTILMHRQVIEAREHEFVDHIDGNKLNNRKHNLRIATLSQNAANAKMHMDKGYGSKYKGVFWDKRRQRWFASIGKDYKNHYLGSFASQEEAAKVYNVKAVELFGEFAKLNDILR